MTAAASRAVLGPALAPHRAWRRRDRLPCDLLYIGLYAKHLPFPRRDTPTMHLMHDLRFLAASAFAWLPIDGIRRPIFILGCGRSGTTIFGTALSKHRHVTYLNEPRRLWFAAYPQADIWTHRASARQGKLSLTTADAVPKKSAKLRRLFRFETLATGRPVLVEKLPINSFRLGLIQEIFPDARFIHIHRNGLEVARSIARLSESGQWFGSHQYKWDQLVQYAARRAETSDLPELCANFFQMGLLEWRLSTEAIIRFLGKLPTESFLEVSYERLVRDPASTMTRVLSFLAVTHDPQVLQFARERIARKSGGLDLGEVSERERRIGGPLLPLALGGASSLTQRAA